MFIHIPRKGGKTYQMIYDLSEHLEPGAFAEIQCLGKKQADLLTEEINKSPLSLCAESAKRKLHGLYLPSVVEDDFGHVRFLKTEPPPDKYVVVVWKTEQRSGGWKKVEPEPQAVRGGFPRAKRS